MARLMLIVACTFGVVAAFGSQEGRNSHDVGEPLVSVLLTLDKVKRSGSLELSGNWDAGQIPDFPQFRFPRTYDGPAIQTLREILAVLPTVKVTEDRTGLIRMIDPSVPTDILNVRIAHLDFRGPWDDGAVHNPDEGLVCIMRSPEVVSFMEARGIDHDRGGGTPGNLFGHWPTQAPHMSGSLDNVTVSEALDHILATFPGIWVYENYPASANRTRDFYFGFFYLDRAGHDVLVTQ